MKKSEKIITDNTVETITVKWDGERFVVIKRLKVSSHSPVVIIFNPKEALELIKFIGSCGKE